MNSSPTGRKGIAAGEGTQSEVENGFASFCLLANSFRFTDQWWLWLNPSDNPHPALTGHWGPLSLRAALIFGLSDTWFTARLVREGEHMDTKCHQILVVLITSTTLYCLYCHYCFYSQGSSPLNRQILHIKRNESVKPQCEHWKSSKEKLIEDLNYLGRKENIYWINMNFKASDVLVLLLVTGYCNGILQDLKVWSDCEALFQIS